ncbi:MAG: hypothetical protein B7Z37_03615 [Verrucomicrobia bacterium 12-59-8]|nr:MAG: hypothetical protein B7Z37_03615 [Verrucomicrobia bacterium 12-59-8]
MKTANVRDLRNHYTNLLDWIDAGEEIVILQRGKAVARLVPEPATAALKVDWTQSPAVKRDRSGSQRLTAEASREIIHEAAGKW